MVDLVLGRLPACLHGVGRLVGWFVVVVFGLCVCAVNNFLILCRTGPAEDNCFGSN